LLHEGPFIIDILGMNMWKENNLNWLDR